MQVKEKHLVIIIIAVVIAIGGYMWFKKTAPERKYKGEIKQLRLISEHQGLEIEVIKQRAKLAAMKKAAKAAIPAMRLVPDEEPKE